MSAPHPFRRPGRAAAVVVLLLAAGTVRADDYTWANANGGAWDVGANWFPAFVPGGGDNATIALGGTYTVTIPGTQSVNNVTLEAAGATVGGSNFSLGGTMTLTAGNWVMGGLQGTPAVLTGGAVTRGAGATGTFTVAGALKVVDTQLNGAVLKFDKGGGALLQLAGTAGFTPGSVVAFTDTGPLYPSYSGIRYEAGGTLDTVTVRLAPNTTLGTAGGTTLTIGSNAVVEVSDPGQSFVPAVIGREVTEGTAGLVTLDNRGVIRPGFASYLIIGRHFVVGDAPSNVNVTNSGQIIADVSSIDIHANTFTNAPGGVVRVSGGGGLFLFGRFGWTNRGTIDVGGDGSSLLLGGLFATADIGTVTRSGANTIGIYAARMTNTGATFALTAATGSYQLLGESTSYGEIIGGAITAAGGAKLEVRRAIGSSLTPLDAGYLTGVQVGPGVLDFSASWGKLFVRGGTTLTAGDTVTLAGADTAFQYLQTQQVDGVTFVLSGARSNLAVWDNNTLTLGPTTVVRKTGAGEAGLNGGLLFATSGGAAVVNRGLVHVQQGTLKTAGFGGFTLTNRGTVQVDAGATWQGPLSTDGGTVRGGGAVDGSLTFTGTGNELRPGASPGTLTVTGNLTLNDGTTLFAELNGPAAGTGHDRLAVTGTVTLAGATLVAALGGGYVPAFGDRLFILTNEGSDAVAGTFFGLEPGATVDVGGYFATISYTGDAVTGELFTGNDVVLYNFVPVPEPAFGLLAAAAGLLGVSRWRRRPGR